MMTLCIFGIIPVFVAVVGPIAVEIRNSVATLPALAIFIPVEIIAMVEDAAIAIDQIGIVVKAHPAMVAWRRGETIKLPILDVKLWTEPERMDEESALKPVVPKIGPRVEAGLKDLAATMANHDVRMAAAGAGA